MTTFDSVVWQPSVLDMARAGNFRALSYWINTFLLPHGIHARVENAKAGCLQILIESQQLPDPEKIVHSICHQIWRLNSEAIYGVRIIARLAGNSDIAWKQSVRIVTPANQRSRKKRPPTSAGFRFKTFRALLVAGVAVTSFVLSAWLTYYSIIPRTPTPPTASRNSSPFLAAFYPPKIHTGSQSLPIHIHSQVANPDDSAVTLLFADAPNTTEHIPFSSTYSQVDLTLLNLNKSSLEPEKISNLIKNGVDLVTVNNEDKQPKLINLERGISTTSTATGPEIIEVKGQRLAYLVYSDPDSGSLESRKQQIKQDISALRSQVDWIIVNYQSHNNLQETPSPWQIELSHLAIEQGADLVVGHHPQQLQGAEIYKGRPVVYSVGSFIFGEHSQSDYETAMLKIALKGNTMKLELVPVQVASYQPKVITGEAAERIVQKIEARSATFNRPLTWPLIVEAPHKKDRPAQQHPAWTQKNSPTTIERIKRPVFPADIIERQYLKQEMPEETPTENNQQPFITKPFINKSPESSSKRHSQAPNQPKMPKDSSPISLNVTIMNSRKPIQLPVFV